MTSREESPEPPQGRAAGRRFVQRRALEALAETDRPTAEHTDDVVLLAHAIGERLGLGAAELDVVATTAAMHDIGKIAVGARILTKPGPLEPEEWEVVRQHTVEGQRMLARMPGMAHVAPLVRAAHERFDGGGYPDGLTADEIPLTSRIVFCADAYHAIRSDRPYRRGRSAAESLAEVRAHAGTQFDPEVVDALEGAARELRLAPPERPTARAQRLLVLLLLICLGGGGSAIAIERSGDRGDAAAQAPIILPAPRADAPAGRTPPPRAAAPARPRERSEPHARRAGTREPPASARGSSHAARHRAAPVLAARVRSEAPVFDAPATPPADEARRRLAALAALAEAAQRLPPAELERRRRAITFIALARVAQQHRAAQAATR